MKASIKKILISISFFLAASQAFGSGFQFFELATPMTALASAGQAAYANDASTAFYNPAGSQLDYSQLMLSASYGSSPTDLARELPDLPMGIDRCVWEQVFFIQHLRIFK